MNAYILKNLRKHYASEKREILQECEEESIDGSLLRLPGSHVTLNININKFEKPVAAVVQAGGIQNIQELSDIIEIKKE